MVIAFVCTLGIAGLYATSNTIVPPPPPGTPPAPRYHHSAVVFQDSMFVFGGYTGDIYSNSNLRNKNDLFEYKFTTSQWIDWSDRISGDLPPARSAHGAVIYDHHLWIYAGYDGHTRLNDMWRIDLISPSPKWEEITQTGDSPPTCCNFPVAVIDNDMFVFSGQSGAKITNNLYQFNFNNRVWVRIRTEHLLRGSPSPPQRRYGHTMVAYRRCLYVYGGGAADGILDNDVHCFDVDSRAWSVMAPVESSDVPCRRVFHSAAVWNNGMYVFGGTVESATNRSGDLYRFSLSTFPKCTLVNDFGRLLKEEQFCDTHVSVGGCFVKAHAVVLAARSPYLCRKLLAVYQATSNPESSPCFLLNHPLSLELPEVSGEAFKLAVYSLYTDRIHPHLETCSARGVSSAQMLLMVDVYKVALLLEAELLVQLSMQYIKASINEQNVLLVLKNATELGLNSLKDYCLQFIVRESNYKAVIMSSTFESLDRSLMLQIIRRQQSHSRPTSPDPPGSGATPPSLQHDLQQLLASDTGKSFTDILLKVGQDIVPSHKAVLAARSSYFEALFRSFNPEDHCVEITFGKHVPSLQAFMSLLRYIYHGQVEMPPQDSLHIFSAPNFFGFYNSQLHCHCKASLERNVCKENVLRMLEASDSIEVLVMKRHCLDMIANNFPDVVRDPYLRELPRELLLDILDILASDM